MTLFSRVFGARKMTEPEAFSALRTAVVRSDTERIKALGRGLRGQTFIFDI